MLALGITPALAGHRRGLSVIDSCRRTPSPTCRCSPSRLQRGRAPREGVRDGGDRATGLGRYGAQGGKGLVNRRQDRHYRRGVWASERSPPPSSASSRRQQNDWRRSVASTATAPARASTRTPAVRRPSRSMARLRGINRRPQHAGGVTAGVRRQHQAVPGPEAPPPVPRSRRRTPTPSLPRLPRRQGFGSPV